MACQLRSLLRKFADWQVLSRDSEEFQWRASSRKSKTICKSTNIERDIVRQVERISGAWTGGIALYTAALRLVFDRNVSTRFKEFREQTRKHAPHPASSNHGVGNGSEHVSAGAEVARRKSKALLKTMTASPEAVGQSGAAELNAIENIVLAETKDHADWELLGKISWHPGMGSQLP
jgi:hypothetical protein